MNFEACSAFTHVTACTLAESPLRPSSTGGFSSFVTSTAAPIATGRNEPVPGWDLHPLWTKRLSRRTRTISVTSFEGTTETTCPDSRHPCSHLSSEGAGVPGALGRACKSTVSGCSTRNRCLSASVPALGRTRHPFAVSGSEEPSQRIEFVFSASPETIRREPRECDLLGNMQDLAGCAFCSCCLFRQYFMLP
ncbi:hypothetical protein BDD14_0176 [Edaphobacter modestus]|uniref:Uncharacterized protein n=1 Tax=Edaphobacter modestus TaxID=388466 RepID=A0A4Q7YNF5_9BACT|nr:hypothetical protein BDD14_0176 [Edaphobacter modestus]